MPAAALIILFSFGLQSGCHLITPGASSKYGSSTQGYRLSQEQLEAIKVGMTSEQVQEQLGAPHINPFYPNIWTYIYIEHNHRKGKMATITFDDDKVTSITLG